jgi:hypothetical protein
MANRPISAACLTLGLLAAAAGLHAETVLTRLEYLTFRAPVALPGVTLGAGSYAFEVANPDAGDVVRVRNRATNRVAFVGFTFRVQRPAGAGKRTGQVVLGEGRRGEAAPILAWYPVDEDLGYQFIYRR